MTQAGEGLVGNKSINAFRKSAGGKTIASAEPLVGSNGEINAGSNLELAQAIASLMTMAQQGQVVQASETVTAAEKKAMVAAAWDDAEKWEALGSSIGEEVRETIGREGFARKFMQVRPLAKGDRFEVKFRRRDAQGYVSTQNPSVVASVARQTVVYPEPYYINAAIDIEEMELALDSGTLLDDRYNDALEQAMVQEDKVFLRLSNQAAQATNDVFFFSQYTPSALMTQKLAIESNGGLPVSKMLISWDIWNDILTEPEFLAAYSPIAQHEIIMTGTLGRLYGMDITTDGFRIPQLQVLESGRVYMFAAPEQLGVMGNWGDIQVKPTDKSVTGQPKRGWFLSGIQAQAIINTRAVCAAKRV